MKSLARGVVSLRSSNVGDFSHTQVVIHIQYLRCRSKYSNTIQLHMRLGERFAILEFTDFFIHFQIRMKSVCVVLKDEIVATGKVNKLVTIG